MNLDAQVSGGYAKIMPNVTIERTKDCLIIKVPLGAVENGRVQLSRRGQTVLDKALTEGLLDIEQSRTFGPFSSVREFKTALKNRANEN